MVLIFIFVFGNVLKMVGRVLCMVLIIVVVLVRYLVLFLFVFGLKNCLFVCVNLKKFCSVFLNLICVMIVCILLWM